MGAHTLTRRLLPSSLHPLSPACTHTHTPLTTYTLADTYERARAHTHTNTRTHTHTHTHYTYTNVKLETVHAQSYCNNA